MIAAAQRAEAEQPGVRRMARTFASLLSAEVATRAFAFAGAVIVVRALRPDGFGAFTYALAIAGVVGLAVELGLSSLVIRDVSADRAGASLLLGTVLMTQALLAVAVFGGLTALAFAGVLGGPASAAALALACGVVAAGTVGRTFEATLTGAGSAHLVAVSRTVRGVALVAATGVVAITGPLVEAFLAGWLVSEVAGAATAGGLCAARVVRPVLAGPARELAPLLRRALPFAALAGFSLLYGRIDVIMLGALSTTSAVGNYGVATRMLETAIIVPAYFGAAFLATVAHGGPATGTTAGQTARALRYILVVCVPLAFALAVAAGPLVRAVAGGQYVSAGTALALLSPIVALVASYAVLSNLQIALHRTATLVKISVVGLMLKLALNAYAIPAYGVEGAAVAAVAAEAAVVAVQWYTAREHVDVPGLTGWFVRLAGSAAAMVAVGVLVLALSLWPVALVAGIAAFAAVAWLGNCVSRDELLAAWSSLRARRS